MTFHIHIRATTGHKGICGKLNNSREQWLAPDVRRERQVCVRKMLHSKRGEFNQIEQLYRHSEHVESRLNQSIFGIITSFFCEGQCVCVVCFFVWLECFEICPTVSEGNVARCYQCIQSCLWYLLAT